MKAKDWFIKNMPEHIQPTIKLEQRMVVSTKLIVELLEQYADYAHEEIKKGWEDLKDSGLDKPYKSPEHGGWVLDDIPDIVQMHCEDLMDDRNIEMLTKNLQSLVEDSKHEQYRIAMDFWNNAIIPNITEGKKIGDSYTNSISQFIRVAVGLEKYEQ